MKAFQDYYPDNYSHCYGCGSKNAHGYQIKSFWDGEESICCFMPRHYHTGGYPDYLYGGLIASLIDCHSAATAAAARCREKGLTLGRQPLSRFVTASLKIDFIKPTPMKKLCLRSKVAEIKGRKIVVKTTVSVDDAVHARGAAVMVQIPEGDGKGKGS